METLKSLRDQVLYLIDEAGDTSNTKTNVDNIINQAHAQRLTQQKWPFMIWPAEVQFSLESTRQTYPLHECFERPYYFYNSTQQTMMTEVPIREVDAVNIDFHQSTGGSQAYSFWGRTAVKNQPSAASTLSITSSSAVDTGSGYNLIIKGMTASGYVEETLTPLGTSAAVTVNSFTEILGVTKTLQWNGTLTITADSGATTVLTLTNEEFGRSYQQWFLLNSPSAADTIKYRFFRTPGYLENDYDVPDIPFPHSKILVWDTLLLIAAYDGQLDPGRVQVWRDNQQRMDVAMRQSLMDGQSIRSAPKMIRYIEL